MSAIEVAVAALLIGGPGAVVGLVLHRRGGDPVGVRCRHLEHCVAPWAAEQGWAVRLGAEGSELPLVRAWSPGGGDLVAATEGDRAGRRVALAYHHRVEDEVRRVELTTVIVALDDQHLPVAVRSTVLPSIRRRFPTGDPAFDRLFVVEPRERAHLVPTAMRHLLVAWRRSATGSNPYWLVVRDVHMIVTRPGWAMGKDASDMVDTLIGVTPSSSTTSTDGPDRPPLR